MLSDLIAPQKQRPTEIRTAEVLQSSQDAAVVEMLTDGAQGLLPAVNWYDEVLLPQKHTRVQVTTDTSSDVLTCTVRHKDMAALLLESVSQPIREGLVKVVKSARMPGIRSKIVVAPTDADYGSTRINPVREVLSPGASAVVYVSRTLYGERVDLVPWHADRKKLLMAAIGQIPVSDVSIKGDEAKIAVKPKDLASAVGYRGSNSRLAGELTGLKVTFTADE